MKSEYMTTEQVDLASSCFTPLQLWSVKEIVLLVYEYLPYCQYTAPISILYMKQ